MGVIEIKIKNERVSVKDNTITFSHRVNEKSTASFVMKSNTKPKKYAKVDIYQDGVNKFSGVIDTIIGYEEGRTQYYDINCIDNHYFVEKRTVTKSFVEEYAGCIAKFIVDNVLHEEGIWYDDDSIDLGPKLTMRFNLDYCDDALSKLEEKTGIVWWVDSNKKLYFKDPIATINSTTITDEIIKYRSFTDNISNFQYRNTQYIKGVRGYTETRVELKKYIENTSIVLEYGVGNIDKIEICKNGQYIQLSTDLIAVKGENPDAAFLYAKDDPVLAYNPWALSQELRLVENDTIRVTYQGLIPLLVVSKDIGQILAVKELEGGSGIVENVDIDKNNEGYIASLEVANGKLSKYGDMESVDFSFETYVSTFDAGELVHAYIPSKGIDDDVLIEEVSAIDEGDRFLYKVRCVKGMIHESWQRFFQKKFENRVVETEDTSKVTDILVVPKNYIKSWTNNEVPSPFNIVYPSESLYPSNDLYPSFEEDNRFNFAEIDYFENNVLKTERYKKSIQNIGTNEIITVFYIPPADCNGQIQCIRFYGGDEGEQLLVTITENFNKNSYESMQIVRNDIKEG